MSPTRTTATVTTVTTVTTVATETTTHARTGRRMMAYVMTNMAMVMNAEDAKQELQDEHRAAGRRTTQEHPHHTTYTR